MANPLSDPATTAFVITPSDSADLAVRARGIYVGVSGNVKVDMDDGTTATFVSLAAGVIHPIRARRVYSTLTTATSILGVA